MPLDRLAKAGTEEKAAPNIRSLFIAMAAALALLALLGVVSLVLVSTVLSRQVEGMASGMLRVHAAEELQSQLLLHNRASFRHALTGDPLYAQQRDEAQRKLSEWLTALSERQTPQLTDVSAKLRAYFDAHREADTRLVERARALIKRYLQSEEEQEERGREAVDAYRGLEPLLEEAFAATDRLVDNELDQARGSERRARRLHRIMSRIGVAVAVLLPGALIVMLLLLRRRVYLPFEQVRAAVAGYGAGTVEARAPICGPGELRSIASCFNLMAERLAQHRQSQTEFLASVAHDLRNPISALGMAAGSARRLKAGAPDVEAVLRRKLDMVGRQVARLDRMVEDLLDISRAEAGQVALRLEPCDLRELVRDTGELFESASEKHPVTVRVPDIAVPVSCDVSRIEQVLNNLLSNAVKYSPAGGTVDVELEAAQNEAVISVTDHGIGIAPEHRDELFKPFRRLATEHDEIPGVGLGLSGARRLVAAHGGRIEVVSTPGQGSTFRVHLPFAPG